LQPLWQYFLTDGIEILPDTFEGYFQIAPKRAICLTGVFQN